MTTRRIKSESIENLKRVVEVKDDNVEVVGDMGVVMADAYAESIKNDEHVGEVKDELEKKADDIKTENPGVGKEVKNEFTAKLVLDEAMEDFAASETEKKTRVYDDDEFDTYWDMDMFDFIYELVSISDPRRKPLDPLGRQHARFSVTGRDKYAGLTDAQKEIEKKREKEFIANGGDINQVGASQVASAGDYIEVYAHDLFRFDDIQEICNKFKFETKGPEETYKMKRNRFMMAAKDEWITYPYVFRIYVPCDDSGYPMLMEDYFATLDLTLEDVMNPEFCQHYRKIEAKIQAEAEKLKAKDAKKANDAEVDKMIEAAIADMFDQVFNEESPYYDLQIVGRGKSKEAREFIQACKEKLKKDLTEAGLEFKESRINAAFAAELA